MPEPRAISPADRAWLAERGYQVPKGAKINRCERGESGLLDANGKFRPGVWKWIAANPKRGGNRPGAGRRPRHDDEIRQMVEDGCSVPMIAKALGMADTGVRKACRRLGLEPRRERALRREAADG